MNADAIDQLPREIGSLKTLDFSKVGAQFNELELIPRGYLPNVTRRKRRRFAALFLLLIISSSPVFRRFSVERGNKLFTGDILFINRVQTRPVMSEPTATVKKFDTIRPSAQFNILNMTIIDGPITQL